jgi:activator of HSP90 ATPase
MNARIQQSETFDATASEIYELLTSSDRFSEMTGGAPADIDSAEGGSISLFGGMITGRTIEAVPNQRLVQAWRPQPWEDGLYSVVRFELSEDDGSCTVSLDHAGFPEGQDEHLAAGWHENYWDKMRAITSG